MDHGSQLPPRPISSTRLASDNRNELRKSSSTGFLDEVLRLVNDSTRIVSETILFLG